MTTRRIISFVIAATLLLSLIVPPAAGAQSCGEATRALVEASSSSKGSKGHGCVGCSKSKKAKRVESAPMRTVKTAATGIPAGRAQAMLCCNDGHETHDATVDVPTLTTPVAPLTATLLALVEFWLPDSALMAMPALGLFKIGASPPFLAAVHQHTYLRTSVFLI